jgi:hypothetical protein
MEKRERLENAKGRLHPVSFTLARHALTRRCSSIGETSRLHSKPINRANILDVQNATKARTVEFLRPLVLGIGFASKVVYCIFFAWWLTPWLRHRANCELVEDTERNFWFLIPEAGAVKVVHAQWPTVQILSGNLLLTVLRWQDETTVSVAPRHSPAQSFQLGPLDDAARLLRARLGDFNAAFSEDEFSRVGADFRLSDFVRRQ